MYDWRLIIYDWQLTINNELKIETIEDCRLTTYDWRLAIIGNRRPVADDWRTGDTTYTVKAEPSPIIIILSNLVMYYFIHLDNNYNVSSYLNKNKYLEYERHDILKYRL